MTFDVVDFSILLAVAGLTAAYFFYKKKPTKPTKPKLIVIEKLQKSFLDSAQVILFFGSQTGTAEDLANRFAKDLNDYSISTLVCDFEDYEMTDLLKLDKSKLVCFFMATCTIV